MKVLSIRDLRTMQYRTGIEQELSGLLGGRKVDLRTPRDISRHFRDEVVRTAEVQYAR